MCKITSAPSSLTGLRALGPLSCDLGALSCDLGLPHLPPLPRLRRMPSLYALLSTWYASFDNVVCLVCLHGMPSSFASCSLTFCPPQRANTHKRALLHPHGHTNKVPSAGGQGEGRGKRHTFRRVCLCARFRPTAREHILVREHILSNPSATPLNPCACFYLAHA